MDFLGFSYEESDWWEGMSKMVYIIFNVVINLKWALLLWHVMSLQSSDTYI